MHLTSFTFLLFAALLLTAYYCIPKRWQWVLLLAGSYVFYLWTGAEYLVFLLLTTASTYAATVWMGSRLEKQAAVLKQEPSLSRQEKKQLKDRVKVGNRCILTVCLIVNFAVLLFCKAALAEPLKAMLSGSAVSFLSLGLPLGISFYMFQSMGYCIDVYRGSVKPEKNPGKLALFVSYFPQLIQGPISRFSQVAPDLFSGHAFDSQQVSFGLQKMLWGYFKKLVIADRIACAVVALKGDSFGGTGFLVLTLCYTLQLYADFTGGMDIVMGLSQTLGIPLPENFRRPFFSKTISEFWRRWHITLGTWMKDYIFFPISVSDPMLKLAKAGRKHLGSVGKRIPVYVASLATWFVTGIWHGLTSNFVLWGMLNCLFIVLSEELSPLYEKFHRRFGWKEKPWYAVFEMLRLFLLINFINACDLFPTAGAYFRRLFSLVTAPHPEFFTNGSLGKLGLSGLDWGILAFGVGLMLAVSIFQEKRGSVRQALAEKTWLVRYGLIFALFLAVLLMGSYGIGYNAGSFIYNQF